MNRDDCSWARLPGRHLWHYFPSPRLSACQALSRSRALDRGLFANEMPASDVCRICARIATAKMADERLRVLP